MYIDSIWMYILKSSFASCKLSLPWYMFVVGVYIQGVPTRMYTFFVRFLICIYTYIHIVYKIT